MTCNRAKGALDAKTPKKKTDKKPSNKKPDAMRGQLVKAGSKSKRG